MILSKKYNDAMDKIVMSDELKNKIILQAKNQKKYTPKIYYIRRGDCRMFGFNGYIYNSF